MKTILQGFILLFILVSSNVFAQDTITGWSFSDNADLTFKANMGLSNNLTYDVRAENGTEGTTRTLTYSEGATDYSASATGWDNGTDDKYWSIKFKGTDYASFKVSSKQLSDANGPKNWKVQTKLSGSSGTWIDIPNSEFIVDNDWTTGVCTQLLVSSTYDNPGTNSIAVRWIMTSNTAVSGSDVTAEGISKIDDILVTATTYTGIEEEVYSSKIMLYPNPCTSAIKIETSSNINSIEVYNIEGTKMFENFENNQSNFTLNTSEYAAGIYLVKIFTSNSNETIIKKFTVQ